jgi:hypothetical protein
VLVYVAMRAERVDRHHAAGSLWPLSGDDRAAGNLRSALWRLKSAGIDVIDAEKSTLTMRQTLFTADDMTQSVNLTSGLACRGPARVLMWCIVYGAEEVGEQCARPINAPRGALSQYRRFGADLPALLETSVVADLVVARSVHVQADPRSRRLLRERGSARHP